MWRSVLLLLCLAATLLFLLCSQQAASTRHRALLAALNSTNSRQAALRAELQRAGGRLNTVSRNLTELQRGHQDLVAARPWAQVDQPDQQTTSPIKKIFFGCK